MMLTVSPDWLTTVNSSHESVVRADVVSQDGSTLVADLPLSGGMITHDVDAAVTAAAQLQIDDPTLLPRSYDSPLAPFGAVVRVSAGLRHASGAVEMVRVFTGPIVAVPTWTSEQRTFVLHAAGWLRWVKDDRFIAPYTATGSVITALTALLRESAPAAPVQIATNVTDAQITAGLLVAEDRWEAVTKLCNMLGCTVRDTPDGAILIAPDPAPDPAAAIVRYYRHGESNALLSGTAPDFERNTRYNAVVLTAADDDTIRGVAKVDTGPVRWDGPFGRRALIERRPGLTADTAAAAAAARLAELRGTTRTIDAQVLPDPAIQPGDHVSLMWPPHRDGSPLRAEPAVVRRVSLPLAPGAMRLGLRGMPEVI